jgi:hypothetical protein
MSYSRRVVVVDMEVLVINSRTFEWSGLWMMEASQ